MQMTTSQLQTLKAAIAADSTLNAQPNNSDGNFVIAQAFNLPASPDFFVWATAVSADAVFDAIVWANFTPAQAIPDATQTVQVQTAWANRALACQGKQLNAQIMLQGREVVNGAKSSFRAGLQDALTNVPSASDGTSTLSAGWVPVRTALARKSTRFEKLYATGGTGADAQNSATMVLEGAITYQDVGNARNS